MPKDFQDLFAIGAACNSSASVDPESGSKTEVAILKFLNKTEYNYMKIREEYSQSIFFKSTFSSAKKRMSIGITLKNGTKRLFIKGASEIILRSSSKYHSKTTGKVTNLD